MSNVSHNRLLIIDDEPEFRAFFRDVAESVGFEVAEAGNGDQFASAYDKIDPTVVLLDLTMPDMDGIEYLRNLAKRKCTAPVILASGQDARVLSTAERLGRMFRLSMHTALQKPISVDVLENQLSGLLKHRNKTDVAPAAEVVDDLEVTPGMIREAITKRELIVFYQPKVTLQAGRVYPLTGSEALTRWLHPELGFINPGHFIPLAEKTGLISDLTEEILRQIIAQQVRWNGTGRALPVAFNLSPVQLTQLHLPDKIASMMDAAGLDRSLLQVEITEEAAMTDVSKATDILTRLRLKEISVSLDDFGSGFSSLVEIYRMPINELKIDRSLVTEIDMSEDARTVVRAIVALARELKLSVCAEGVETARTAKFLNDIGCDKGQGFLFGKAMSAADFSNRLAEDRSSHDSGVVSLNHIAG